jgi:hypothetical protein
MNTGKILAELRGEHDRVTQAITGWKLLRRCRALVASHRVGQKVRQQLLQRDEKASPLPDARDCRK